MKPSRTAALLALAMMLALSSCAQGESSPTVSDEVYEFPPELLAAGAAAAAATTTTIPSLSEPEEPVEPPTPRAVQEALSAPDPLPLPSSDLLPDAERLEPFVVTDGGERRLLSDVSVEVSYDIETGLSVDPAGWWVVNYPLERIIGAEGQSPDDVAMLLTGSPVADLTNYYFYTAPFVRPESRRTAAGDRPCADQGDGGCRHRCRRPQSASLRRQRWLASTSTADDL